MRFFGFIPSFWAGAAPWLPKPFKSKRTTVGTYFDHEGILREALPFSLRPKYGWTGTEWVYEGSIVEGQATNNVAPNTPFSACFGGIDAATTEVVQGPGGLMDGIRVLGDQAHQWATINRDIVGKAFSFFIKPDAGGNASFAISVLPGGENGFVKVTNHKDVVLTSDSGGYKWGAPLICGDGWIYLSFTHSETAGYVVLWGGLGTMTGLSFAGLQVEDSESPTTPIINTTQTPTTRTAD